MRHFSRNRRQGFSSLRLIVDARVEPGHDAECAAQPCFIATRKKFAIRQGLAKPAAILHTRRKAMAAASRAEVARVGGLA
jgi:hypothetical protein